uniref:Nucleolar complex protein 3 homolog n=1 Tax=Nelumbo nucifera TaxID=4432 RepID=A0A822YYI3_NELNU|nr:TPA_asm: hypothetical protein HUJ06_013487 [Nelumbo nucifera]
MGKKKKVILPPQLPPELKEDEIEVSDEDVQFVKENREYAGFVSKLDTQSITRHVTRVANKKEEEIEALYEKRIRKNRSLEKENEEDGVQVDPVDALPVKTLDGKLYYRTMAKESRKPEDAPKEDDNENAMSNEDNKAAKSIVKLTKAERRAKLKKSKKEAKKQEKELTKTEELQTNPQAEVLAEVKEEISAEEAFAMKKCKLAELGMALLADPESNIKFLKEMLQISKDEDHNIVKLGLLSLLAVFKDIIPGYRIRLPTEKEQEMTVSKAVRKTRYYESTLLSSYKAYLQKLIALEKQPSFQHVAVRCICALLDAVPHFNFSDNLLVAVVKNISSFDDVIRKLCCATVKSLFANEGKHGGEATGHAVHLIADHVKVHDCQLHPDSIEVFLSLTFAEDLGRSELSKDAGDVKGKKNKRKKNAEELKNMQVSDRKKSRQELLAKTRAEVHADLKAVSFAPDIEERRRMQSETLSAVFQTYFRILKHTLQPTSIRADQGEVLAEALKTLLCEGRQHDMQRAAAFIKRLCTFSLCFGSAEAMAALVTLRHLLQKNVKCRNLLENDVGGGSLSGLVAKYQPYAMDPNLSGALASVLWELSLLSKHYHPSVSTLASSISNMGTGHSQAYLSTVYPQQAFADLLIEKESFDIKKNLGTLSRKMKSLRRSSKSSCDTCIEYNTKLETDDEIKQKLSNHFIVLKGIAENERLRKELNRTVSSLKLYEEYKKQKRKTQGDHSKARKKKRLSSV